MTDSSPSNSMLREKVRKSGKMCTGEDQMKELDILDELLAGLSNVF